MVGSSLRLVVEKYMCMLFFLFFTVYTSIHRTQKVRVSPIYHEMAMRIVSISVDLSEVNGNMLYDSRGVDRL